MTGEPTLLAPRIRELADQIERDRRLPPALVRDLADSGVFRLLVPRVLGGLEAHPRTLVETVATLAAADASVGWCAAIAATSGVLAAYLSETTAREVYGDTQAIAGGAFAPQGSATTVDGGFRVTGRWAFASGCQHCTWLMGGTVVHDDGRPRLLESGRPDVRLMLFPAAEAQVIDTWHTSGLRGTGSHDIAVRDLFVPRARAVSLITDRPVAPGPLYAFPVFGLLAVGIAAVAVGTGRAAIDELGRLAGTKTPTLQRRRLAERGAVQAAVAEAEALVRAGRSLLGDAIDTAWTAAETEGTIPVAERAALRLAATHATRSAARAVDLMYDAGGGTSVYATSPLQRHFRDVHAMTQHLMVAPPVYELVGRVLLDVDADLAML